MKKVFLQIVVSIAVISSLVVSTFAQKTKPKNNMTKTGGNVSTNTFKLPPLMLDSYTLKNGLRVVLNQDNASPVVSMAVYYDVGSRNEKKGRTGFAHLFEHMMFQGSENVKKAEHFQFISKVGGTMNGTTSTERTNYYQTVPASELPLVMWLESDRMRSLAVTKENLDNQRNAVQEEKRLNFDNRPYGQVFDTINEMVFKNFANSHSTIGSMDDLNAATVDDVKEFFRIYYAPNNAVLSISGSFDPKSTKALIEKYFGSIPSQPKPPAIDVSEPVEVAEKARKMEDKLAPLPAFLDGYKIPARNTKEFKALSLAGKLLYEGESSRLYQKLVKGDESVVQIFGFTNERRGPSSVVIGALPKPNKDVNEIRKQIYKEIKAMSITGPSADEMEKLHNQLKNDAIRSRQSSMSRAMEIAEATLYDGNPNLVNTELDEYLKITPDQIRAAVDKYLNTSNRSQLDIVPAKPTNN
jgi:predicted Zn-dependent peptidase